MAGFSALTAKFIFNPLRNMRSNIFAVIVICALLIYGVTMLVNLRSEIKKETDGLNQLQQEITDKELSNAQMSYAIENSDKDEVIEDVARDKLGLVSPGEQVFYDNGK